MSRLIASRRLAGWLVAVFLAASLVASPAQAEAGRIKALFLGDNGHHTPGVRAGRADPGPGRGRHRRRVHRRPRRSQLREPRPLRLPDHLRQPRRDRPRAGTGRCWSSSRRARGWLRSHCASYCFRNSPKYIALVGGQFKSHTTGVFRVPIDKPDHPAMKGVKEFEAWDETYTHTKLSDDRDTLMTRDDGGKGEPWTWVRTQGKGRVFYTASGHDERVFTNPGFQGLVAQGVRWAVGRPDFTWTTAPFATLPAELPNYLAGERGNPGRFNEMQAPAVGDRIDAAHQHARRLPGRAVRRRARYRQADHDQLGRPRPRLDRRDGRLSQRACSPRARGATGSRSARIPTATARPTSSRSSPTS